MNKFKTAAALTLCFSMMCSVSYAEGIVNVSQYSDIKPNDSYFTAVNVLSELNIVSGYGDKTFKPDKKVTRAEMAKMIVEALKEREAAEELQTTSKFTDVIGNGSTHWAAGYINQGVDDGFISGYSDTEFGPDDNITYIQAQKMLVSAIGYDTYVQAIGGWPNGYKTYASGTGITRGLDSIPDNAELTRAQTAQLIFNTMDVPICVITAWTTDWNGERTPTLEVKDGEGEDYRSFFTDRHYIYTVEGKITKSKTFSITTSRNFDGRFIEKSDKPVEVKPSFGRYEGDLNDYTGKTVTALIRFDEKSSGYEMLYMY